MSATGKGHSKSVTDEARASTLRWIQRALNMNLAPSGHQLISGLQNLLARDPKVYISKPSLFLLACLLNPMLEGARKFIDIVLEGNPMPYLSQINLIYEYATLLEHQNEPIGNNDQFWDATFADVKALANSKPIEDFHWITSAFLGDSDGNRKVGGKRGVEYLRAFGKYTLATMPLQDLWMTRQIPEELLYLPSVYARDGEEKLDKAWNDFHDQQWSNFVERFRSTLSKYFTECQQISAPTYPGLLGLSLRNGRIVARPVDLWPVASIGRHRSISELEAEVALSLEGFISLDLIRRFERIINAPGLSESVLQEFFEQHPDFLFLIGEHDDFKSQISLVGQVLLSYEPMKGRRPDFLLRDSSTTFWDILEIKPPNQNLVRGIVQRRRLSDAVMEGKAQLLEYQRYFNDEANRQWVRQKYGVDVFYPRLYLLIGHDSSFRNWAEKKKLLIPEKEVEIITYDDLLRFAKLRWLLHPLSQSLHPSSKS